jgi:hypothetical protein
MPLQKYLELDSSYRNRNLDPSPGQFTVTMSQNGIRPQEFAVDPVSNAYPQIIFSPKQYTNSQAISTDSDSPFQANTYFGKFSILVPPSTPTTLYLSYEVLVDQPKLPSTANFFVGMDLIHYDTNGEEIDGYPYRRISEWECVQNESPQIFKLTIDTPFSSIIGNPMVSQNFVIPIVDSFPLYFLPASLGIPNYYNNYLIQNISETFPDSSPPSPVYAPIIDFDRDSHYASAGSIIPSTSSWTKDHTYCIRKEIPIVTALLVYDSTSTSAVLTGLLLVNSVGKQNLINAYFNLVVKNDDDDTFTFTFNIRRIIRVEDIVQKIDNDKEIIINYKLILDSPLPRIPQVDDKYEILQYSNDNYSPFVYNGTMGSNSQPVAYEISLNSLSLPNRYLTNGGRIAYYPFVYVTLENVSSTSGNAKNLIFSNNPNTYRVTFKVPITDLNHPAVTPFVKLNGNGMRQTMIFKQNDDMFIKIQLPNGELFETQELDTTGGLSPNPVLQISAVFSMERIQ